MGDHCAYSPEKEIGQGSVLLGVFGALLGAAAGAVPLYVDFGASKTSAGQYKRLGGIRAYGWLLRVPGLSGTEGPPFHDRGVYGRDAVYYSGNSRCSFGSGNVCKQRSCLRRSAHFGCRPPAVAGAIEKYGFWPVPGTDWRLVWAVLSALVYRSGACGPNIWRESFGSPAVRQELPRKFTVRNGRQRKRMGGALCALLFAGFLAAAFAAFDPVEERSWLLFCICIFAPGTVGGIYSVLNCRNYRLEVDGEYLRYVNALGRARDFYTGDIYGLGRSPLTGAYKLFDKEGWLLGWFDPVLENGMLLVQYLRDRGIGLGARTK